LSSCAGLHFRDSDENGRLEVERCAAVAIMAYLVAVLLRREAGDGELAAIHTQTRYVDSFRRRVVRDVNDLLKVMVGLLLARARVLVAKVMVT
jgi:hypothetical protein